MRLVLVGPPGAGKGTQAEFLCAHYGIPHISTGDIFRANLSAGTALGVEAKGYMDRGDLVPDSVTNSMVESRLNESDLDHGFLLDGFPRNAAQAAVLKEILKRINAPLDSVLELQIDEEEIVTRLASRNRDDDNADVVRHRLKVYRDQTAPIIDFYRNENLLIAINASGSIADITERAIAALSLKNNLGFHGN